MDEPVEQAFAIGKVIAGSHVAVRAIRGSLPKRAGRPPNAHRHFLAMQQNTEPLMVFFSGSHPLAIRIMNNASQKSRSTRV
ncbi:MAG: hypothetical protein WAP03_01425 [Methylorubrum rhodinum]|uniref:hypothetical protein n=1 Tax=Methylorubrum rhodinum TaxID=29428 RepID=UPI003BAF429C